MSTTGIPGGWSEWKAADDQVKEICELAKHEAEKRTYRKFPVFILLSIRKLISVRGTTYEIKVYVGNDLCLFLRVFQGLGPDAKPELQDAVVFSLPNIILHTIPE